MKTIDRTLLLGFLCLAGCEPRPSLAPQSSPPTTALASSEPDGALELRFVLPEQDAAADSSTAGRWQLAAPVIDGCADPNAIVYDQSYIEQYVKWAVEDPIACGASEYKVVTPDGERTFHTGLDEAYLGRRFRAESLVKFLRTRAAGKHVERTFRVQNAEAVKLLRDNPQSTTAQRLRESPWERDTRSVASLLGFAGYGPARTLLVSLAKDPSPNVRYTAVIALGRLAIAEPAAVDDLVNLLDEKESSGAASDALVLAGNVAIPAMTRSLDHPDSKVRNHIVYNLGRVADPAAAAPALNQALAHPDKEIRHWATAVVVDLITRAGPAVGQPYVDALATRLKEDPDDETRRNAALALLNMKSLAAPAEATLRQAADQDENGKVRDLAQAALDALPTDQ